MGDSKRQQQVREHRRREGRLKDAVRAAADALAEGETAEALGILRAALEAPS